MLLIDRVALIAGGNKGIGRAVSRRLAAHGSAVAVVGRDPQAIDATVRELRAIGGTAVGVAADCTRSQDVEAMLATVTRELGEPDILVNTVGGGVPDLLCNTSDERFDHMLDLNVRSTFLLSRAVAPAMIRKQRGKIIHTSSIGAKTPTPGLSVYDGCKAFVVAFTRDLAAELGRFNINVNCVCPGHIPTDATQSVGEKLGEILGVRPEQLHQMVMQRMAIGRFPTADDIAGLYLFLASSDADCMTGQAINFSCGLEMR